MNDFIAVINVTGNAEEMKYADFIMYENGVSQGQYTNKPLLKDIQEVKFVRGSTKMFWKTSMDDGDYQSGEFMKKKLIEKALRGRPEVPFPSLDNWKSHVV